MKKRIVIIIVLNFLLSSIMYAQGGWFFQNVNTTANLININFPSVNTGYIAGWSSAIIKTTDGGNNWFHLSTSGLNIDIQSIFFTNTDIGWSVGGNGKIIATTNGGLTWSNQFCGYTVILFQVFFNNAITGWIVGESGILLKTTNSGLNWNTLTTGTSINLAGITFSDLNTGYIVGDYGLIMKTTNGGNNWVLQYSGVTENFSKNFFVNSLTGWAVGYNGTVVKTTNGGNNWVLQPCGVSNWMIQPFFVSPNTGWISCSSGLVMKTTNGGNNWIGQPTSSTNSLHGLYFTSESTGWVCGFNGMVYKTTTGGVLYTISGYAKYNDNNQPVTIGTVKAIKLNKGNGSIIVVDSALVNADGSYTLTHVSQDTVDIGIYPNSTTQNDYVITHYPSTTYWERAATLYPTGNISNVNIGAIRMFPYVANNSVNGKVMSIMNSTAGNLKDAVLYAKLGNAFVRCGVSDVNGVYHLPSLPTGTLKIIANRIGFSSDSININVTPFGNIDSVNFYLRYLYVGIKKLESSIPSEYRLYQNYPNPFNPNTVIRFQIKESRNVTLKLYDITGKEIATLINEKKSPGVYEVTFDASELPSGIYFYKMIAGDFSEIRKMVLIK